MVFRETGTTRLTAGLAPGGVPTGKRILLLQILIDDDGDLFSFSSQPHLQTKPVVESGHDLNLGALDRDQRQSPAQLAPLLFDGEPGRCQNFGICFRGVSIPTRDLLLLR